MRRSIALCLFPLRGPIHINCLLERQTLIDINGYQTAAEQRTNIGAEQESAGYSDCDTSAGRSSSEAASREAASKAYAVRRAVLWSVAQREYRAWETALNIDYAALDTRKAAALTRRGKRWERGHLALVEGWKPSFPGRE